MTYKRTEGKLKVDYGSTDYYKYYCSNEKNPISNEKFNKITSLFNEGIVNLIIEENLEFTPVKLQFTFCVRKYKKILRIQDGKLINTNPIDWKTTNQLWEENPEAKEKKIIIKYNNNHTSKNIFRIKMLKTGSTYNNKFLFRFKAVRSFRSLLSKRILDPNKDNFNTFNLY